MITLKNLRQELKNKERKINDLIRHISTRTDNNPNYSLLLGAGCSVTSGVRSGEQLTREWKEELYRENTSSKNDLIDKDEMEDYFNQQMWYDSRNPYSTLFEKKYDLPRQRRMFVEQEVRDKTPSIGYAYLTKLIENNFFKTVFTTNFDDLLNEAFYQFSTKRPIVCAHDSSINSITITSKRPKIIKLHGDYLFDDIKSTRRETESLDDNIKNKFVEFSKDYGLVVIGYGGNDRSIVETLTYLLKNEEYFKNGIYWCLREGSEISEELRKLLWKERVYYVAIEGFDELFSEVHNKLNQGQLPIDNRYFNKKKNDLIDQILSNKYLLSSKCDFIKKDLGKLESTRSEDFESNYFNFLLTKTGSSNESRKKNGTFNVDVNDIDDRDQSDNFRKKNSKYKIDEDKKEIFVKISLKYIAKDYQNALIIIEENLALLNMREPFYIKLLSLKGSCLRHLNNEDKAIDVYLELLKQDKTNIENYVTLSELSVQFEEKIKYIDKAIEINQYSSSLLNIKAFILYENILKSIDKANETELKNNIKELIEKSIKIDPSYLNSIWSIKLSLLSYELNDTKELTAKYENILNQLEEQNPYHPRVVNARIKCFELNKASKDSIKEYILNVIENNLNDDYLKEFELLLLDYYCRSNNYTELNERISYIENTYEIDNDYLVEKAEILLEKFDKLDESISILESISPKTTIVYRKLFQYYLLAKKISKAKLILDEKFDSENHLNSLYFEAKRDFEKALEYVDKELVLNPSNYNSIIRKSYLLLKKGDFQEAYNFANGVLKYSNFNDGVLLVNYFFAKKKLKNNVKDNEIIDKLINRNGDNKILAASYALLGNTTKCYNKIKLAIKENKSSKYSIREWVVMEDQIKIEKISDLLL